jgi:hypothetical protein
MDLFNEVKAVNHIGNCKKNATNKVSIKPIFGIKDEDGKIITLHHIKIKRKFSTNIFPQSVKNWLTNYPQ